MFARRRPAAFASAVALVVGVSMLGCTPSTNRVVVSPTVSRDRMLSLVDETAAVLQSTDWREASGAYLQTCWLEGGEAVNYGYTRLGPPSTDPHRDAALVADFWKSKGYRTKLTTSSNPNDTALQLFAVGEAVKSIRYEVDTEYSGFVAESVCIHGDRSKIIESGDF